MRSFFASLKSSWQLGRGSRELKKGNYDRALRYFLSSHACAQQYNNAAEIAVRMEAIAETYKQLEKFDKARQYAIGSLDMYNKFLARDESGVCRASIDRVNRLLNEIEISEKIGTEPSFEETD